MNIEIEINSNDLPILQAMSRLIENNRDKLGKDYIRAVEIAKTIARKSDFNKSKQYQRKLDSSTLIHDAK